MKRRVASILLSMAMVATMVPANLVSAAPKTEETAVQSTEYRISGRRFPGRKFGNECCNKSKGECKLYKPVLY